MKLDLLDTYFEDNQNLTIEIKNEICEKIRVELEKIFKDKCRILYHFGSYQTVSFIIDEIFVMEIYLSHGLCILIDENIKLVKSFTLDRIEILKENYKNNKKGQRILAFLEEVALFYGYSYMATTVVISNAMAHILLKNEFIVREGSSYTDNGFDYYKKIQ